MSVTYDGHEYEYVKDAMPGGCSKCIADRDPELCGYLGESCDGGHYIEKEEEK